MDYEDGDGISNYINFVASINTLESEYELAGLYLELEDYTNMTATLNTISSNYTLDAEQTTDLSNWQSYFSIAQAVKQSDIYQDALSTAQITQLEGIVSLENSPVSTPTCALLMLNNPDYEYYEVVKPVEVSSARKANPIQKTAATTTDDILNVYPNPSHDYITIEYRTGDKYNNLRLIIKDVTSKTVLDKQLKGGNNEELINLTELKPDIYTLMLYGDKKLIATKRITVLK